MNSVLGYANLLSDTPLSPQQREYLKSINSSGQMLLLIINDILDFSKIEADKIVLQEEVICLRELCAQTLEMFGPMAREKKLDLRLAVEDEVPDKLLGDGPRIQQVLVNLLSNAVKFTESGFVELHVSLGSPGASGPLRCVSFRVADTGIGIASEQMERLFKPFSQIDSSIGRRFSGTGLGLVIVERLCKLMGGKIEVDSMPGKGSTFLVTLNLAVANAPENTLGSSAESPQETVPENLAGSRVLVVEDNALNRRLVSTILARWGIKARVATSGIEALELVRSESFDVILMDVQMPGLDGFESTRRIRQWEASQPGRPRHRIVALTALATRDDSARCFEAGMDDYLTKPLNPDSLKQLLLRILSSKPPRQ